MRKLISSVLRISLTLGLLSVGVILGVKLWRYYTEAPWTRDGRIRAEVVSVAPEVSGRIADVKVVDNAFVHKGDVLYTIDQTDYALNLDVAQSLVDTRRQDLSVKTSDNDRREKLSDLSVTQADRVRFRAAEAIARAARDEAAAQLGKAKLDLDRTAVRSPVNGYVTNLRLRVGDYAAKGAANIAVVDSDLFWIAGYFEETKLAGIHVGDRASAALMGFDAPIVGHVESVSHAVSDQNGAADSRGLASVNPVFTWVRLAQRIPVRIHIDEVPQGVELVAGTTCTVSVGAAITAQPQHAGLFGRFGFL